MGAWGAKPFENDSALDWFGDLEEPSELRETLEAVLEDEEYLEVDDGSSVIAAAEIIAAAKDGDASRLHPDVRAWFDTHRENIRAEDAALAARAVREVLNNERSELAELWAEGGEPDDWRIGVDALLKRLG